ncbi:MAG: ribonuclease HII [Xanthomonadales bacterium]|nr:ribonuclease HII [Xanthomonadales bacterium]
MKAKNTSLAGLVAGVDEAGRGPLAGPVVVAAVILDPQQPITGLDDSKRLTARRREMLFDQIQQRALAWSIVHIDVVDIDRLNILQATLWGMQRSVFELKPKPSRVLIDGNRAPELDFEVQTIVQGDRLEPAISAASILAKVSRDRYMLKLHIMFPNFGFDQNKGYPTPDHLQRLQQHGPCTHHRKSFAPVRRLLQSELFN